MLGAIKNPAVQSRARDKYAIRNTGNQCTAKKIEMKLHGDRTLFKLDGEPKVFERAEKVTEIGLTKLYEYWAEWFSRDGDKLPKSFIGAPRIERPSTVIKLFSGEIRKFVLDRKLIGGQSVEVPDVMRFLKDTHGFEIERNTMHRAMKKMGFLYGKKTKLMRNKVNNMNIFISIFISSCPSLFL